MKIELNGKSLLAIVFLSAGFVFAEYVSIIGDNGISYTVTENQISMDEIMPVGSIVLRIDNVDPSSIYGGSWELITGDAALSFGNGTNLSGSVYGDNTPSVPLPSHSHKMRGSNASGSGNWNDFLGGSTANYGTGQGSVINGYTTAPEGESNAKLNVRGARIDVNVWKRNS